MTEKLAVFMFPTVKKKSDSLIDCNEEILKSLNVFTLLPKKIIQNSALTVLPPQYWANDFVWFDFGIKLNFDNKYLVKQ